MAIGPVQLVVLSLSQPDIDSDVMAELERLRQADAVRIIDALILSKDAQGELEAEPLGEARIIDALIGLDITNGEAGDDAAAGEPEAGDEIRVFSEDELWDVVGELPNDSAALLILFEHCWAVPLRDAMSGAGAVRIADGFVSPLDLAEIGLIAAREAQQLHAMETTRRA